MRLKHTCIAIITFAAPDLFLKHPDATLATYKRRQMKHLEHVSEMLKKHLKTLENHCKTYATSR
jgi:O-succinylbenzoate synthase